jgi:hypothetical protein
MKPFPNMHIRQAVLQASLIADRSETSVSLILLCQIIFQVVMPAGKRASSATDGKLRVIHTAWIPAIHAGMTTLNKGSHVI